MNLNQLYYFQTLARLEHYTKASQELYISQPTLTHAIKELENELGIPLFKKQGRNVILSKEGKIYLNYVNQSLDCLQRGNEHMKNLQKQQKKMVQIGVIPTIINTYFAPILKTLKIMYPDIDIRFRSEKTNFIIHGIKNNLLDFGICSKVEDKNLVSLPLLYEELVLITPKNHPLSSLEHVTLKDITQYPFITYTKDTPIYHSIMNLFNKQNLHPQINYTLDDETAIASMVSLDFGIAIVGNNSNLIPFKNIDIINLNILEDSRLIYLVYNKNRELSKTTKTLIYYMISRQLKI